jgi:hypothetical protein
MVDAIAAEPVGKPDTRLRGVKSCYSMALVNAIGFDYSAASPACQETAEILPRALEGCSGFLALACVASLAEITADIGSALRSLAKRQNPQQRDLSEYFNSFVAPTVTASGFNSAD